MHRIVTILIVGVLALGAETAAAEAAAQLMFGSGNVTAIDARGYPRALTHGSEVNSGDTVVTGTDARAQLRFADGGIVSLQAETRLRIDDYRFGGAVAEERGFFSLIKGGLRAISGALGKYNRAAYRLTTPVATVGIRGTHFTVQLCAADCRDAGTALADGLYASVVEGQIELSNTLGAFLLDQGHSVFIANAGTAPVPTVLPPAFRAHREHARDRRAPRPPAMPTIAPLDLKAPNATPAPRPDSPASGPTAPITTAPGASAPAPGGTLITADRPINTHDQTGLPVYFFDGNKQTAVNAVRVYGIGTVAADGDARPRFFKPFSINDRGELVSFGFGPETFHGTNALRNTGYTGLIGWGRWTGGQTVQDPPGGEATFASPASLHYVMTGTPTPAAFFASGATLTYNFLAGTPSSSADGTTGGGIAGGTLTLTTGANPTVGANFTVGHAGISYSVATTALPVSPDAAAFGGSANFFGGVGVCNNGCPSSISGIFAGPLAQEAGIVYQIGETTPIHGAGVFR